MVVDSLHQCLLPGVASLLLFLFASFTFHLFTFKELDINIRRNVFCKNDAHIPCNAAHTFTMFIDEARLAVWVCVNLLIGGNDMIGVHRKVEVGRAVAIVVCCQQQRFIGS